MKIRNPSNAAPNVRAAPARAAAWQHGQAGKRAKMRLNGTGKMRVGIPYGFIKYTGVISVKIILVRHGGHTMLFTMNFTKIYLSCFEVFF